MSPPEERLSLDTPAASADRCKAREGEEPDETVAMRDGGEKQSARYIALYAMAAAGGSVSYAPFLTLVLPLKVMAIDSENAIRILSYIAFVGAIAASLSNIAFGWLSDRTRNRTAWILAGMVCSCTLLVAMRYVDTVPALLVMIVLWQTALNMMLNPLAAWAGDCIPDHQKGALGGALSFAPGMGALAGAVVTIPGLAGPGDRLVLIAALVALLVLPVLIWGRPRPMPHLMAERARGRAESEAPTREPLPAVWRMWAARLLLQIAEAALFAFLFMWMHGVDPRVTDNTVATLFAAVLFCSVPVAIAAGRWSDKAGRPILPLTVVAACGSAGLVAMAMAGNAREGMAAYALFGIAAAVFLALHSSQTLRVLPQPRNRGRDLGLFNLTNTAPSLIMPGLTLALIPLFGFDALFLVLALLLAGSALLLAPLRLR